VAPEGTVAVIGEIVTVGRRWRRSCAEGSLDSVTAAENCCVDPELTVAAVGESVTTVEDAVGVGVGVGLGVVDELSSALGVGAIDPPPHPVIRTRKKTLRATAERDPRLYKR
jgi:hypothetical protein